MSDKDIISEAKEAYRLGIDAEKENRDSYEEDYAFARLDEQWPEDVKRQREAEGRPCLTIPRLQAFIRQVVNDARQNRPRIKTKPIDSFADVKTAQVLDGIIRNIEHASNASIAYDTAADCSISGGFGYFRIDVDYAHASAFEKEIKISRILNPLQVVGDPYSESADSSDWNQAHVTTLLKKEEFGRLYKGAAKSNWEDADYRLADAPWMTGDEVMVAEYWKRVEVDKILYKLSDGRTMLQDIYEKQQERLMMMGVMPVNERPTKGYETTQHLLTGAEVLETVKWPGCYIPIVPVYGEEMFAHGRRIFRSLIASAKDAQRRHNYWQSAATEIVALAPKSAYIGEEKAFTKEPYKWATVNQKSWPHIAVPNGVTIPQRQPLDGGQAIGAISQAMAATDDMKAILGMYDASLGQRSNETSGVAINARKKEGDTATFHFIDNLGRAVQHGGRIIVDLIPYVYTPGTVARILGHDGRAATVKVQDRDPSAPKPQAMPFDEQVQEGTEFIYDFGLGRYDVSVDTGPSYTTRREETANQMIQFVQAFPPAAAVMGDKLAKNLDWQDAEEIGERLKKLMPPQVQDGPPPEVQEMQQQMEGMGQQMQAMQQENEALKQDKMIEQQKLQLEAQKLEIERYKAETDRMEAIAKINAPPPQPMQRQPGQMAA